eukprot:764324-Pelagomonas_calceolata.AAC.1
MLEHVKGSARIMLVEMHHCKSTLDVPAPASSVTDWPQIGLVKPQAIMPYRINGQYIMEGACGGLFYTLGGRASPAGFINMMYPITGLKGAKFGGFDLARVPHLSV